jgi:hypothetical protein
LDIPLEASRGCGSGGQGDDRTGSGHEAAAWQCRVAVQSGSDLKAYRLTPHALSDFVLVAKSDHKSSSKMFTRPLLF